jgi:hypothetical protein
MYNAYEHPAVSRALRTGYGYGEEEQFEREEREETFYYSPDVGEMDKQEALAYMLSYCRENFSDAVEMFGFDVRSREVYGEEGDWY